MQGGGRAEDGADVSGIHNVFKDGNAAGCPAKLRYGGKGRASHGAEHPAREGKAGELCEHFKGRSVHPVSYTHLDVYKRQKVR